MNRTPQFLFNRLVHPAFALLAVLHVSGARPSQPVFAAPAAKGDLRHVILISLDTTRADHLSLYGYPLATSPNLDRFARRAVVFENARTVVPLTGPSHTSILTSLYPHQHGAFRNGIPLKDRFLTLAEYLESRGYDTAAFVSGWTLRREVCGLDQGFRIYDQALPHRYKYLNRERLAEEVTNAVQTFIADHPLDRPLFLFVHYFDPHDPYRHHRGVWGTIQQKARLAGLDMSRKALAYDAEVTYMDHHLGRLLDAFQALGLFENAITLIVADHGESLGEHDYWGHGRRVYEPGLHVPMVLYAPALFPEARRIQEPVSTLDILPTLLSLLGLPIPEVLDAQGTDLSGLLVEKKPLSTKKMYFETFRGTLKGLTKIVAKEQPDKPSLLGYYNENLKYILHPSSARIEVYDLSEDPAEQRNLSSPGPASHVESHLMGWFQEGQNMEPARPNLSQEDIEQLRSLGYIE